MSTVWTPSPKSVGGVGVLASTVSGVDGPELALHTASGDKTFWTGVNLGSTTPGHEPGELSPTATDYHRWLAEMGDMNVHFLRIYTLLPPDFYDELLAFNQAHQTNPIYLIQGVYLPDESYVSTHNLWAKKPTEAFTAELQDVSAAVGGDYTRVKTPGRASGTWTSDVSPWLAAWIIGAELDPVAIHASDQRNSGVRPIHGRYFSNTANATATEAWYAGRLNELATIEIAHHRSAPIALINWPTTDPLRHPTEPSAKEDLVGVDANHVLATKNYPGGSFASYHAYPYYPDFLRYTAQYSTTLVNGKPDAYLGYLTALKHHHEQAGLATVVTEFGVPSSIGSAHFGTNGRDQGAHTEQDAMQIDADIMRAIKAAGLSGALVFEWTDEWFKRTWNTEPRQDATNAERRALWHDPLTNEQWFGMLAEDPVQAGWRTVYENRTGIQEIKLNNDAAYVYLDVTFDTEPVDPVTLAFAILGGAESDVQVTVSPADQTAHAYVRTSVDPIGLDGLQRTDLPAEDLPGWRLQRLTANRSYPGHPAEFVPVGDLVQGDWDPASEHYNSMATWSLSGTNLRIRMPWSMLLIGDPSTHTAVTPSQTGRPVNSHVPKIKLLVSEGTDISATGEIAWDGWNRALYKERMKAGVSALSDALADLGNL